MTDREVSHHEGQEVRIEISEGSGGNAMNLSDLQRRRIEEIREKMSEMYIGSHRSEGINCIVIQPDGSSFLNYHLTPVVAIDRGRAWRAAIKAQALRILSREVRVEPQTFTFEPHVGGDAEDYFTKMFGVKSLDLPDLESQSENIESSSDAVSAFFDWNWLQEASQNISSIEEITKANRKKIDAMNREAGDVVGQ